MLDDIPEAPRHQMRVDNGFATLEYGSSRHTLCLEQAHRLYMLPLLCPGHEDLVKLCLMLTPHQRCGKAWVPCQMWLTDSPAQPLPFGIRAHRNGYPAILPQAGIHPLWHPERMAVPRRARD